MTKFEIVKNNLIGDPDQISSEKYFVTLATLVASVFLMILCFVHLYLALQTAPVILAGSSSILMLALYYFVRFRNFLLIPKIILTLGGLIMLDFTWYSKFLSNGPVLFFILIFAALVIWVWEGKHLVILLTFYFINLAILFYIDYNAQEFQFKYPDLHTRSIDIFFSFFLYSILLIFLLYVFKREFLRQKSKAIKSDKLKSAFLANMSHEIRTPMNGILGFAGLLKEPNLFGDTQRQYIEVIEKSGHRMLNIINDIIDISKIEAGLMKLEIKESNINEQFDYIYTFFKPEVEATGMKLSYKKSSAAIESNIFTDREKAFAILTNLEKND
ncbi:MAG: histidine kinase dimerization/phospho-acceptor domain-containing protein, partial [Lutibacter sp.]